MKTPTNLDKFRDNYSKESGANRGLEVRTLVIKGSRAYDAVLFFGKNYGLPTISKTVKSALIDFKILFDFFNARTFEGLIKKIGIKVRDNPGVASFKCPTDFENCESYHSELPEESQCVKDSNIGYCVKKHSKPPK